jgi:hypothetical protein
MGSLQEEARTALNAYQSAMRKQKRQHWKNFLEDAGNIWKATKYLSPLNRSSAFGEITSLQEGGRAVEADSDKASVLLRTFFPPLPQERADLPPNPPPEPVGMGPLTMEEIENAIQRAKPFKAAGDDSIPTVVWKEIWPVAADVIYSIFKALLQLGALLQ